MKKHIRKQTSNTGALLGFIILIISVIAVVFVINKSTEIRSKAALNQMNPDFSPMSQIKLGTGEKTPLSPFVLYGFVDLGTLGGLHTAALDINNNKVIVGNSRIANGIYRAFVWMRTRGMSEIPLNLPNSSCASYASGINENNQVAGFYACNSGTIKKAFFYDITSGKVIILPDLVKGDESSEAYNVNGSGVVVGRSHSRSVMWKSDGSIVDLTRYMPLTTSSYAGVINNHGDIAGGYILSGQNYYRGYYLSGSSAIPTVIDIGTLPGYNRVSIEDINDDGTLVGYTYIGEDYYSGKGFMWKNMVLTALTPMGSYPYFAEGINNTESTVGFYTPNVSRALLWESNNVLDFNAITTNIPTGVTINAAGKINLNKDSICMYYMNGQRSCLLERLQ